MKKPLFARRSDSFTLIELIVVIAIIALMAGLLMPNFRLALNKAQSVKCSANLHAIGTAANLAASDNHNKYLEIDQAGAPIYTPPGPSIVTALAPYGITTNITQCPADMATAPSSFSTYHSSYEWDPIFDDETVNETIVYITPTVVVPVNDTRVRLAMDFARVHNGRPNVVYGDGHMSIH